MMTSSDTLRFFHRGEVVSIGHCPPTRTVLDWLREDRRCVGTKEGCYEGDCGACTVVVGVLDPGPPERLILRSVNACLQFLPMLHARALFTVEDLTPVGVEATALHPVQQALVDCHGSQCGFCTPGFVMSLWALYERHQSAGSRPSRQELADELAGNLCRCTGYRPILDAGERMFELPPQRLDAGAVIEALRPLRGQSLALTAADGNCFLQPATVDELAEHRLRRPAARLIGGATDVALWVNKQFRGLGDLIGTGAVAELARVESRDGLLEIGAGATLDDGWRALDQHFAGLREVWLRFAGPPVRNAGTLGGNIVNGSPIGDGTPLLLVLDASLRLRRGDARRELPLDGFHTGYQKNRLAEGEFLESITVRLDPALRLRAYKVSKRHDSDISAVLAAFAIELDGNQRIHRFRAAFGGLDAIARRAPKLEAALLGQRWDRQTLAAGRSALAAEFRPLSDLRASAGYRLQVAGNLLERFWLETRPVAPLAPDQVSVWARS